MSRYNHAYDFAFEVISNHKDAEDVTLQMIRSALLERANRISDEEIVQACGHYDTFKVET